MPAYTRGQYRENLVFVPINPVLMYGWKTVDLAARTGLSTTDLTTQLGHIDAVAAQAVVGAILVTGANSPKPARVVKRDRTAPINAVASTSTFMAFDKGAAATAAGWTISTPQKGVRLSANVPSARTVTAIAELSNGVNYAFPLNQADFTRVAATLGLQDAAAMSTTLERQRLVTGSKTKPGRCSIAEGTGTFSSYFSTDAETAVLAAGYNLDHPEFVEFA